MKSVALLVLIFFLRAGFSQSTDTLPLIPRPADCKVNKGVFKLSAKTTFRTYKNLYANDKTLAKELVLFNEFLAENNGFTLSEAQDTANKNVILLQTLWSSNNSREYYHEWYSIEITENKITLNGDSTGIFYALQTLKQLICTNSLGEIELPCLSIFDRPQYKWRGMHLDVCRHFFSKEVVKKYIDLMALYKLNTFHWHLTEDQGWRIEIKKYPKLTQVGAWRSGSMIGKYDDHKFDTVRYGGFYTQEEIREIVAYAQKRHVTIVPEIEMPGHSVAAIASYPFLSCSGKNIEVEKNWGVFKDVYCTKDSTFEFLENVLCEVMALFPGKYIHIGGDECPKESWKKCPRCRERIKFENLKDEHGLQSYFIKRIEQFVNVNGRQIIGWDEILEGGLAPNAAVMSWRGTEGGISAAGQKHFVVMSPGKPCYFDHYQSKDRSREPLAIGGYNPLDSVYAYNPTPKMLGGDEQQYILGAQANLWTEYILNEKQLEYMALPRMCALAEVLWTTPGQKNYPDFVLRLKTQRYMLDKMNVNYAKHFLNSKNK